jgi:DNA-binding response OmpR family regulator
LISFPYWALPTAFTTASKAGFGWLFRSDAPDVVVLDVMMPEIDGFTLAGRIREVNATVPLIFLTARSQTADVVKGFELGGNDYLKKPFSLDELIVRIKALLSRKWAPALPEPDPPARAIGAYRFDSAKQKLTFRDQEVTLSHRESELLRRLYQQRNQVLERAKVLQEL